VLYLRAAPLRRSKHWCWFYLGIMGFLLGVVFSAVLTNSTVDTITGALLLHCLSDCLTFPLQKKSLLSISLPFIGETNFETLGASMAQFWTKTLRDSGSFARLCAFNETVSGSQRGSVEEASCQKTTLKAHSHPLSLVLYVLPFKWQHSPCSLCKKLNVFPCQQLHLSSGK
jgi:hypothetical protein